MLGDSTLLSLPQLGPLQRHLGLFVLTVCRGEDLSLIKPGPLGQARWPALLPALGFPSSFSRDSQEPC